MYAIASSQNLDCVSFTVEWGLNFGASGLTSIEKLAGACYVNVSTTYWTFCQKSISQSETSN